MVCTSLGSLLRPLFYFLCYIHLSLSVQNCRSSLPSRSHICTLGSKCNFRSEVRYLDGKRRFSNLWVRNVSYVQRRSLNPSPLPKLCPLYKLRSVYVEPLVATATRTWDSALKMLSSAKKLFSRASLIDLPGRSSEWMTLAEWNPSMWQSTESPDTTQWRTTCLAIKSPCVPSLLPAWLSASSSHTTTSGTSRWPAIQGVSSC